MLDPECARRLAEDWIASWNSHDLERIVAHYDNDVIFSSPFIERLRAGADGSVRGRAALSAYFQAALSKFPDLHFNLRGVFSGTNALTLVYESVNGLLAAETMLLDDKFLVHRVWAQYDGL